MNFDKPSDFYQNYDIFSKKFEGKLTLPLSCLPVKVKAANGRCDYEFKLALAVLVNSTGLVRCPISNQMNIAQLDYSGELTPASM